MTDARIPFLDLGPQNAPLESDLGEAVLRVVRSGQFTLGPEVESFERAFADYCGVGHAVALSNGTAALHVGLLALGVRPGDEVVTVAHTFIATVEAILYCGATPVFTDIHPRTLVMDARTVEEAVTERTRAIVPVHLYGNPVEMGALREIADRRGIPVLEDAAQAHGAEHAGKRVGGWGAAAAFSFYPTKNLGALGEGGILTTDDAEVADLARSLRNHGQVGEYRHERIGFNYRMTAFQGACLGVKLPHLETWNEERRALAARYDKALAGSEVLPMEESPESRAVYHLYIVQVPDRDRVRERLAEEGIATRVHYPGALFEQPAMSGVGAGKVRAPAAGELPVTRAVTRQVLSLPFYPGMPAEHVDRVAEALREAVG